MKLKDMKNGVRYVAVTNGSTIMKGEHVYLSGNAVFSIEAKGFLIKGAWERLRNEVEIDVDYHLQNWLS